MNIVRGRFAAGIRWRVMLTGIQAGRLAAIKATVAYGSY
jgi:hypothetical protein